MAHRETRNPKLVTRNLEPKTRPSISANELVSRPRRLRRSALLRSLVRENSVEKNDLIFPMFVCAGQKVKREITAMPGNFQFSVDRLLTELESVCKAGISSIILFGLPERKDAFATEAYSASGPVPAALRAIKKEKLPLICIADVCLCEYTDHGHCGLVDGEEILNDPSLEVLARTGVALADAGADIIAPSDMMDGRVAAIRAGLDAAGHENVAILSYAAKYASAFYGPFRQAADSAPQFGDRRSYQMDPANGREALKEVALDIQEGADMVMVKPALPYLDIVYQVRQQFQVPVAAYHVSGEFSAIMAAAQNGWLDEERAMMECLVAIKRAGADFILTYYARQASLLIDQGWFR
ncbi:MAG TPA: porphobilinogen synthase [Acidobacteriota bacterium]|jgi:porphobilinogen synthase